MTKEEKKNLVDSMRNLRNALEECIQIQKRVRKMAFELYPSQGEEKVDDPKYMDDYCSLLDLTVHFANCCFYPKTGGEVFSGTMNDGKAHLMFDIPIDEKLSSEWFKNMLSSSVYTKFVHHQDGETHHFYVDCGEDVAAMVGIIEALLVEVYEVHLTNVWMFESVIVGKKKSIQREAVRAAMKRNKSLRKGGFLFRLFHW